MTKARRQAYADVLLKRYLSVLEEWQDIPARHLPKWVTASVEQMREELDRMYDEGVMDEPEPGLSLWGRFCLWARNKTGPSQE
jgi:hypothetical protein